VRSGQGGRGRKTVNSWEEGPELIIEKKSSERKDVERRGLIKM